MLYLLFCIYIGKESLVKGNSNCKSSEKMLYCNQANVSYQALFPKYVL